jgi:hypothetical protein
MNKRYLWMLPVVILLGIQFIRPSFQNPASDLTRDFKTITNPPAEVVQILDAACYDCHSNQTRYPWYSQIAPVSWWLANHINEGREHLNFSTYGNYSAGDQAEVLEESAEMIIKGKMPLKSYTWTHADARLSDAQRKLLVDWFNSLPGNQGGGVEHQEAVGAGNGEVEEHENYKRGEH